MTRGQRGRELARAELALAVGAVVLTGLLFIGAPGSSGPMFAPDSANFRHAVYAVAVLGLVVGLIWMIRIYRAEPEPDQHMWRYRS